MNHSQGCIFKIECAFREELTERVGPRSRLKDQFETQKLHSVSSVDGVVPKAQKYDGQATLDMTSSTLANINSMVAK